MKANTSFRMLALSGLVLVAASCQQDQPPPARQKPAFKVTSNDPRIRISEDTALFNRIMNSSNPPDSIPLPASKTHKK